MQTAVVGTQGTLSYRLNLEDFPANAELMHILQKLKICQKMKQESSQ